MFSESYLADVLFEIISQFDMASEPYPSPETIRLRVAVEVILKERKLRGANKALTERLLEVDGA
jgi:hypothetical protein